MNDLSHSFLFCLYSSYSLQLEVIIFTWTLYMNIFCLLILKRFFKIPKEIGKFLFKQLRVIVQNYIFLPDHDISTEIFLYLS